MLKQKSNPVEQRKKLISSNLKRQLSVPYVGPDGRLTSDDPNAYEGKERVAYQDALIKQYSWTGYADGIIAERKKTPGFFPSKKKEECVDSDTPAFQP